MVGAHIAYKIIFEQNESLSDFFEVNFLAPASSFFVFYVLIFHIVKSSFMVAFFLYFFYFFLWGLGVIYLLSKIEKLSFERFLALMILSLNSSVFYGMPSFMIAQPFLFFFIGKSFEFYKKNKKWNIFLISLLSVPVFYFLHPVCGMIFIAVAAVYFSLPGDQDKKMKFISYVAFSFFFIILMLLFYSFFAGSSSVSLKERILSNPYLFVLYSLIVSKLITFIVTNNIFSFSVLLPILVLYINEKKEKPHVYVILSLLLLFFALPEYITTAYLLSGRILLYVVMFVAISADKIRSKEVSLFYSRILLFLFLMNAFFLLFSEQITSFVSKLIYPNQEGVQQFKLKNEEVLTDYLHMHNYSRVYFSLLYTHFGLTFDEIDKGYVSSLAYLMKTHPIHHRGNVTAFFEAVSQIDLFGIRRYQKEDLNFICNQVNSQKEEICKFYQVIVLNNCKINGLPLIYNYSDPGGNVSIYSCK